MGSLSPSSSETQATEPVRSLVHSLKRVVFPKPAGAERRVSLRPGSRVKLSIRRGLATSFGRAREGCSLVDRSGSNVLATSPSDHRLIVAPMLISSPVYQRIKGSGYR